MSEKVYTLPEAIRDQEKYLMTGNQWLALPTIRERDAGIMGVNCTSLQAKGLIEFRGGNKPLLQPILEMDGTVWTGQLAWQKEYQWVPRFSGSTGSGSWGGVTLAPVDERGWFYRLWVTNTGKEATKVKLGWNLTWAVTSQLIYHDHLLGCTNRAEYFPWTNTLVLEARGQTGLAALAFGVNDPKLNAGSYRPKVQANGAGEFQAFIGGVHQVAPGQTLELDLVVGVNVEADGAAVTGVHLRRQGFSYCYNKTIAWLERVAKSSIPSKGGAQAKGGVLAKLEEVILRNLFFNYFYSTGQTIDTGELVLLTSRSSRYYVSGAFWARDAFLWSFPAILLADREKAFKMLEVGLTRYVENGPFHSCYIDGTLLYPGFELDELAAFLVAIHAYDQVAGNFPWQESWVLAGAKALEKVLWQHHNQKLYLFSTFLDPSDDQVEHPYLTYANALAWLALHVLQQIYKANNNTTHARHLDGAGRLLKKAITQHCVVPGPFGPMYAWAVDGEGNYQLYDNPPGSLQLLLHYGFTNNKDKVWQNTMSWIYSEHNSYAHLKTLIKGTGGLHAPAPWVLGACNSLLAGKVTEGLAFVKNSEMDNGYACETVDPNTGKLNTGAAFAPCAGFLAYSLLKVAREQGWQKLQNI